jgi:hypothetical protein
LYFIHLVSTCQISSVFLSIECRQFILAVRSIHKTSFGIIVSGKWLLPFPINVVTLCFCELPAHFLTIERSRINLWRCLCRSNYMRYNTASPVGIKPTFIMISFL